MDIIQAIILSIIEGVTEFLPISSTGHMILASTILSIPESEFVKSFEIIIQMGAIAGVLVIYYKSLLQKPLLWLKIWAAFIPTAIAGLIFYKIIKQYLLGNPTVTTLALLLGGIVIILFEFLHKEKDNHIDKIENLNLQKAFMIGIFQSISIIPGVSRAAATILGGMFLGLKRDVAVEFSFLLAIPTLFAASGLDLVKSNFAFSSSEYLILGLGLLGSFITAYLTVKFFLKFIQSHTFLPFGIYRIVVSILFWLIILR